MGEDEGLGAGGYYARLFFNVRGREKEGIVDPGGLSRASRPVGARSDDSPRAGRSSAPDADPRSQDDLSRNERRPSGPHRWYFDALRWRSAGTIGYPTNYLEENDTGPDDAVHGTEGIFIVYDPERTDGRTFPGIDAVDVLPTLLTAIGEEIPARLQGRPVLEALPVAP